MFRMKVLCLMAALLAPQAYAASWSEGAPIESARIAVRATVSGNQIYAGGGATLSGPSDVFEAYDPRSNHWLPLESMPEGKDLFGMAAIGNRIYVAGGLSSLSDSKPSATVYAYDTAQGRWTRVASMPATRSGLTLSAVSGSLYAIGGTGSGSERVVRYDPSVDKWQAFGAAMPAPRSGHAAAVLGNKVYIVGGRGVGGEAYSRVDIFDAATGQWSSAPSLPMAITGCTADFLDDELHVAGGLATAQKRTLRDHYVLVASGWTKRDSMLTARQGLASAAMDGKWYVIGGGAGNGAFAVFTDTDAVEIYAP